MEKLVQGAISVAHDADVQFREGLPLGFLDHIGAIHEGGNPTPQRLAILKKIKSLFGKLFAHAPVDAAADQIGADFVHGCMPPVHSEVEYLHSAKGRGRGAKAVFEVNVDTQVRLSRRKASRLVIEQGTARLYHSLDNSLVYKAEPPQYVEFSLDQAAALEHLLKSDLEWVTVSDLPVESDDDRILIARVLYDVGVLLAK